MTFFFFPVGRDLGEEVKKLLLVWVSREAWMDVGVLRHKVSFEGIQGTLTN